MTPPDDTISVSPRRLDRVAPFLAMDVFAAAAAKERQGASIIHMEVGQHAAPTPRPVLEAARAALDHGLIGYTPALGLPELRVRIARHYRDAYAVEVAPERVVVTTGSSAGFVLAFLALFDPGARVAISAPGYPAYRNILAALDLEPVALPLRPADRWTPTSAAIEAAADQGRLDGVLLMSPANPSGTMIGADAMASIAAVCRRRNIRLVSDEIYHGLTYAAAADTALNADADSVVINSFSKYYCMTGWRIGWLVVPDGLVRPIERLAQNLYISAPYLSQVAAIAAFDAVEELEIVKAGYRASRDTLLDAFPALGLGDVQPADGAFYLYADIGRLTNDSTAFCRRMLDEAGVAATPGLDFDPVDGAHHVRFSFAGGQAVAEEAVRRLKTWLQPGRAKS